MWIFLSLGMLAALEMIRDYWVVQSLQIFSTRSSPRLWGEIIKHRRLAKEETASMESGILVMFTIFRVFREKRQTSLTSSRTCSPCWYERKFKITTISKYYHLSHLAEGPPAPASLNLASTAASSSCSARSSLQFHKSLLHFFSWQSRKGTHRQSTLCLEAFCG